MPMKKIRTTKRAKAKKNVATPKPLAVEAAPLAAAEVLARARQTILQAVPAIVTALADGAKQGNHLPAKFLFEFAGLSAAEDGDLAHGQSLAEVLLAALPHAAAPDTPGAQLPATPTG